MQLKRHQSVLEYRGNFGHTINIFIMVMDIISLLVVGEVEGQAFLGPHHLLI